MCVCAVRCECHAGQHVFDQASSGYLSPCIAQPVKKADMQPKPPFSTHSRSCTHQHTRTRTHTAVSQDDTQLSENRCMSQAGRQASRQTGRSAGRVPEGVSGSQVWTSAASVLSPLCRLSHALAHLPATNSLFLCQVVSEIDINGPSSSGRRCSSYHVTAKTHTHVHPSGEHQSGRLEETG